MYSCISILTYVHGNELTFDTHKKCNFLGGYLCWNIADGYEGFNAFFLDYDEIINEHVAKGEWSFVQPAKKQENMLFEDAGYTYVMKKH